MKITKAPPEFAPVTLTFETEEEFLVFKGLVFYTESIPNALYRSCPSKHQALNHFLRETHNLCVGVRN